MHLSNNYKIVKRRAELLLVNIVNGDIFEINDVVLYILEHCDSVSSLEKLGFITYNEFSDVQEDEFTLDDLNSFIGDMVLNGIIEN